MLERRKYIDKIIKGLSWLKNEVELSNSINFTDVNISAENFYRDFLNLIYEYNLVNINIIDKNAEAIDLGDINSKIAIQVTSTQDIIKAKKTVNSFINKKLYEKYDRLIILNIRGKIQHKRTTLGTNGIFSLDLKRDIKDYKDILDDINNFELEKIKKIYSFINEQIGFDVNQESLPKEISTFVSLIELLSDETHELAGKGFIEEPDPRKKIEERFSAHADFLKSEYQELYIEYGHVLSQVIENSDIGTPKIRRLGLHLKSFSDETLSKNKGDPKEALSKLVVHYRDILAKNNRDYNETAIRFFLIDQLINCNIFPNKELVVNG